MKNMTKHSTVEMAEVLERYKIPSTYSDATKIAFLADVIFDLEEQITLLSANKFKIPEWDFEKMRPKTKMPDCPMCEADELGMINESNIKCYQCGLTISW